MTREIVSGAPMVFPCSESSITGENVESPTKSVLGDRVSKWRKRDLEKKMTSAVVVVLSVRTLHFLDEAIGSKVGSEKELTFAEIAVELTSQCVEIISRGGWVDDLDVTVLMLSSDILGPHRTALAAQHEESLNPSG